MQVFPVVIDYQIVPALIAGQILLPDNGRVANNKDRVIRSVHVDEATANVQRLMNVAKEVDQQSQARCVSLRDDLDRDVPAECEYKC